MYEFLVIGKGLMGAAATRYLSQVSDRVAVLGPDEPADPENHTGIYGAHYDQARMISQLINREPLWAALSHQTLTQIPALEAALGEPIYQPVGCVAVEPTPFTAAQRQQAAAHAAQWGATYAILDHAAQQTAFPFLHFPENCTLFWEKAPAGYLNPRKLLAGQLAAATQQNATIIREIAKTVVNHGDHVAVYTQAGQRYQAQRVIIATGAFTNCFDLFPRPLALRLKIEYVVMGELPASEVARLRATPPITYQIESDTLADLYLFPPVQYPNGKYYLKMGANTIADRYVETLDEINAWYRHGNSDIMLTAMRETVCQIFPGLQATAWHTNRCVITRTAHAKPYIDIVQPGRIYAAIGGNGTSAQASDGIGQVVANLALHDRWQSDLAANAFRLIYADEAAAWHNRELARGQMKP
ncbi:MAG: FAD-binding oxidoreductase [Caldilineaceae bacterium]|nr:FAD-binding oxidoreductase [Caldilineaceae bacterium]